MIELIYKYSRNIGFLLLAGLFFLGSCSNETEIKDDSSSSPVPVLFNAAVGTVIVENGDVTRAGIEESNPGMENMDSLVTSGREVLIYGTRYNNGSADWLNPFMNGLTGSVKKVVDGYKIDDSPLKYYYPEDDEQYDFKLFFPAPLASSAGGDSSGVTILPPTSERPLGLRVNLYRRPDLLKATLTDKQKTDQPLETQFEHLLTSVVLKIIKTDEAPDVPEQDIFINRMTVSGVTRGTYDIIKEKFEPPVKTGTDPSLTDATSGASILIPGYNRDSTFLVPAAKDEPALIREIFLFPVASTASTELDELERYVFDIWLNERRYSFMLPTCTDLDWEGWKPGERYTYTIKVNEADIYIELDEIQRERWKTEDKEDITIGVGGT